MLKEIFLSQFHVVRHSSFTIVLAGVCLFLSPCFGKDRVDASKQSSLALYNSGTEYTGLAAELREDLYNIEFFGIPLPNRQAFIDQMISRALANGVPAPRPQLIVLMGTPGSGKSTIYDLLQKSSLISDIQTLVISPDKFKTEFPEYYIMAKENPEGAAPYVHLESLLASDLATYAALRKGFSLALDGSNSHLASVQKLIEVARASGRNYQIILVNVQSSLKTATERANARFVQTGRSVPMEDIASKSEAARVVLAETAHEFDQVITVANETNPVVVSVTQKETFRSLKPIFLKTDLLNKDELATHGKMPIDVVFDVDWTLVLSLQEKPTDLTEPNVFEFEGKYYRFADHASEVIEVLLSDPRIRISFFSGGDRNRVEHTLKQLRLRNGLSAFEIAFQILCNESLTAISRLENLKFWERNKKDLLKVLRRLNLGRAFLVEDIRNFAINGQERNTLWLGRIYRYFGSVHEMVSARAMNPTDVYIPPIQGDDSGFKAWQLGKQSLIFALGAILESIKNSDIHGKTPVEAMNELIRGASGEFIDRSSSSQIALYRKGQKIIETSRIQGLRPGAASLLKKRVLEFSSENHSGLVSCQKLLGR